MFAGAILDLDLALPEETFLGILLTEMYSGFIQDQINWNMLAHEGILR